MFQPVSTRNSESRKAEEMQRALLAVRTAYLTSLQQYTRGILQWRSIKREIKNKKRSNNATPTAKILFRNMTFLMSWETCN
jgi:hypothetical protein